MKDEEGERGRGGKKLALTFTRFNEAQAERKNLIEKQKLIRAPSVQTS